jgi:hypothetical protein
VKLFANGCAHDGYGHALSDAKPTGTLPSSVNVMRKHRCHGWPPKTSLNSPSH